MKSTKVMLALFATFLLTWLTLGFINYIMDGTITFREACKTPGIFLIMLIVGWIPAVFVAQDVSELD